MARPLSITLPGRVLGESWTYLLALVVLAGLTFVGTRAPLLGAVTVFLAALLVLLVCFDLARVGTGAITLAMFLAPLNDLRLGASYVTGSDIMFVIGIAILAPTLLRNKVSIPPLFLLGLGILFTMGVVASVASAIPVVSINQVARLLVGAFMLPIFFMIWRPQIKITVRLAAAYVFGCVFSVGWGLLSGPVAGDARYVGFTYHPNYLGLECLLAAALTPYLVAKISPGYRWIFWFAAIINAYGVYISGSRAALLVLGMLVVIYPFVEGSIRAVGAVMLGVAGVLAFSGRLLQEDGNSALGRLFGNGSASGSDIERQNVLAEAWKLFLEHPFLGNGFDGGLGSHNIYLQVATAVGIFGLLGYLLVLWTALRPLFWQGINHRLAYPVLAYGTIGPLTNTLWDRLIWSVIALTFAANLDRPPPSNDVTPTPAGRPRRSLTTTRTSA
ncbi:O-antigen ligase [Aeromicrobium sp. A1-2]|uniref:O-antigen ligase family protein n=1 Tax=Aeromicrobium sp. A1-2 TaxID=2107713 RepID=UPI0013C3142C|nr:O-antigen ligase family protein [Aeromicrobium sp. A1-2]